MYGLILIVCRTQAKELQALLYGKPKGKTKVPTEAKKKEEKGRSWRAPKKRASIRGKHGKQQGPQKKTRADQSDFPQCPECDVRIANVSRHLRQAHNYTEAQVGLYKSDMPGPSGFALGIMSLHSKYLFLFCPEAICDNLAILIKVTNYIVDLSACGQSVPRGRCPSGGRKSQAI